ncbi:MAG: TerB N-terminal domain-containing protein [Proteobacteria bacterium]|nr:TerB N-terminal domain-containing protein [Pseudomonadota bacterium]
MHGKSWLGVKLDDTTDANIVYQIFDRAVNMCRPHNFTYILDNYSKKAQTENKPKYHDTPVSFYNDTKISSNYDNDNSVPEKIRKMKKLYDYGNGSFQQKCKNFYVQGKFMEDYEDDAPWDGEFHRYFPTYFDLNTAQLRGYFTWRTNIRKGVFKQTCTSLAYLYVYELLNGIGTTSPEDALEKLQKFTAGYIESGIGDANMLSNIQGWMLDICIIHNIAPEIARQYASSEMVKRDEALAVLRAPKTKEYEEIYDALCLFADKKLTSSLVVAKEGVEGKRLFAELWKYTQANYSYNSKSLFSTCFGYKRTIRHYPFGNAVYFEQKKPEPRVYELNESRKYTYRNATWEEQSYSIFNFDKKTFNGLIHEAERQFRLYLKTGNPLKQKLEETWASPFIEAVIEIDRKAKAKAARPKVTIRFSDLDQIRRDALSTCDSLLTEEDLAETHDDHPHTCSNKGSHEPTQIEEIQQGEDVLTSSGSRIDQGAIPDARKEVNDNKASNLPLSAEQIQILSMLLHNQSVKAMIASHHGMATVIADGMNEALFDLFGDNIVECDGEDISLVEDYRDDIQELLDEINE